MNLLVGENQTPPPKAGKILISLEKSEEIKIGRKEKQIRRLGKRRSDI